MTRENKFRAWHKKEKRWLDDHDFKINPNGQLATYGVYAGPRDIVVMQYTGSKDKKGKEIYEGDVVMLDGSKIPKLMEFYNGCFALDRMYFCTEAYRMTVIGNIFENQKLLK